VPLATESIAFPGISDTLSDTTVCRYYLENDVKCRECHGIGFVIIGFSDGDQKNGKAKPPHIVVELRADLLVHEATSRKA
jgi:hypothetical protein